jgi:hypothetical protein
MAIQFPHLTPSMIHAALACFYDHREAFDEAQAANLESSREKAGATMDSPLRYRLASRTT